MEKTFKDYAHLYLGCELTVPKRYNFGGIVTDLEKATMVSVWDEFIKFEQITGFHPIENFKPILRPLSDMTKEEIECISKMNITKEAYDMTVCEFAKVTKWHLEKGFDLFGLIDAGIAIDKNKV